MPYQDNTNNTATPSKARQRRWVWLIPLIIFAGVVVMLFLRLGQPTDIVPSQALNRPVPKFVLPTLSNPDKQVNNTVLPQDTAYVLNVWGSWCPSCRVEHPLIKELAAQGVTFVGVNYKDELTDALEYLHTEGNPFYVNIQDRQGDFAIDLGLTGAPESFVVDAQGHIRQHIVGVIDETVWRTQMQPCYQALMQRQEQQASQTCQ